MQKCRKIHVLSVIGVEPKIWKGRWQAVGWRVGPIYDVVITLFADQNVLVAVLALTDNSLPRSNTSFGAVDLEA